MAHSFLSVEDAGTERTICVTDSILRLFMYLFNEAINKNGLTYNQLGIYNHYELELVQVNTSFINVKLQEVYQEDELMNWYTSMLYKLSTSLDSYGNAIDNNYLNEIGKLKKDDNRYTRPIEVSKLKNLINDLHWVLGKENVYPSGDFKWFENPRSH